MSKIPKTWILLPLGEVIQIQKGKKPVDLGPKSTVRKIPYINIKAFEKNIISEYAPVQEATECEPKDTLLVWDGARAGLCGRGSKGYVGSTLSRIRSDLANPDYLYYFIDFCYSILNTQTKGVGIPHINPVVLNQLEFPLPPEKEQPRIVEKIEELLSDLDNAVSELKAAQTKLTQYRQSLLKSAVEGTLTQQWRETHKPKETGAQLLERNLKERRQRWEEQKLEDFKEKGKKPPKDWQKKYREPVNPDTSELPELPEGWAWASLDQCTLEAKDITDGPFGSNLKTSHYTDSGPRVIRLQNIGDGTFHDVKAHITATHYQKLLKHSFETGDTVVAMMGEDLPRACSIPENVAPGIVKADCARVRVNPKILEPILIPYYLNSQPVRARTKALVKGIGRPRINLSHIRGVAIPVVSPDEQRKILDSLAEGDQTIDQQLEQIKQTLLRTEAQRKNILKDAFAGKLVEQVPNDEPASLLLERINEEREEQMKQVKPKRVKKKISEAEKLMETLREVLMAEDDWIDAQEAFRRCGVSDGTDSERIEELYAELRRLDKENILDTKRVGEYDQLKLKSQP